MVFACCQVYQKLFTKEERKGQNIMLMWQQETSYNRGTARINPRVSFARRLQTQHFPVVNVTIICNYAYDTFINACKSDLIAMIVRLETITCCFWHSFRELRET